MVFILGMMAPFIKENGNMIWWMGKVNLLGQMVEHIKANGKITWLMGQELIRGTPVIYIKEVFSKILNKDLEFIFGAMVWNTKANGSKTNLTEKVN